MTVLSRRHLASAAVCAAVVSLPRPAHAVEVRVAQLRVAGTRVSAGFEVSDLLRETFLELVRDGRAVFLQLEAELWEDRRVFDRTVASTPPLTWRIDRDTTGPGVLLQDEHGGMVRHPDVKLPLPLRVDLGAVDRIVDDSMYYVHATLTAATVDEREVDRAGEAIFGNDQSGRGLASLGRFVFNTLFRMGKYFESATTEVTSRRTSGRDIKRAAL